MSYIVNVGGGGVFSILHQFFEVIIDNIDNIDLIKQIKLNVPNHLFIRNQNIFDNIFDFNDKQEEILTISSTSCSGTRNRFFQANLYDNFFILKEINKKLVYNTYIINEVNNYVFKYNIDDKTLGIHIRLTDMNNLHSDYGIISLEDYILEITNYVNNNKNITKLFIASDNNESINKIINIFPNLTINYFENQYRVNNMTDDNFLNQVNNLNDINFIVTNFIENIILSKCCGLIHRISDFANYAIINSDTFKDIICLK